jgi:hypothetical protein
MCKKKRVRAVAGNQRLVTPVNVPEKNIEREQGKKSCMYVYYK